MLGAGPPSQEADYVQTQHLAGRAGLWGCQDPVSLWSLSGESREGPWVTSGWTPVEYVDTDRGAAASPGQHPSDVQPLLTTPCAAGTAAWAVRPAGPLVPQPEA